MDYEQAKTIVKRLQHSPLRLDFALGVYNLGGGEPFVRIDHERGPYAGQTDRIMTWEEWLAMYETKYFPPKGTSDAAKRT